MQIVSIEDGRMTKKRLFQTIGLILQRGSGAIGQYLREKHIYRGWEECEISASSETALSGNNKAA